MKYRLRARPKLSFRPELEHSEQRLLLSTNGLVQAEAHRDTSSPNAVFREGGGDIGKNVPIFSWVVTNNTTLPFSAGFIKVKGNSGYAPLISGSINLYPGQRDLLYTTDAKAVYEINLYPLGIPPVPPNQEVQLPEGKRTSIAEGFKNAPDGWEHDMSPDQSNNLSLNVTLSPTPRS